MPALDEVRPSHAPLVPSLDDARPSHVAPRPVRPLPVGGPPPTVIRDLDVLFKRESKPSAPRVVAAAPAQAAIDPARFAQMLLQKVESDFTPARPPIASAPASLAAPVVASPAAPAFAAPPSPRVVAFVPSAVAAQAMERTAELALPEDDEDVAQLVPWYRRLWTKLFAR